MTPKTRKSYWKQYDSLFKKYSKKSLFKRLKKECEKLGKPYEKKDSRGRKPKFDLVEYAAFICLQKIFRHRYREMELESTLYLADKADHSTFHRNYEKIREDYIKDLITGLVNKEFSYWIADSTAMSSKVRVERISAGTRRKECLTDKYHVLIGYDPPNSITQIIDVHASDNHVSDSQAAIRMLREKQGTAYFLGDSAYNTYELHEKIREAGLFPLIKPDKKGIRKKTSAKAHGVRLFSNNLYKNIRGIVETIFGESTNAGLILSYAQKEHTRRLDTLMLALRHNLMTSMRLLIKINYATNSYLPQPL